MADTPYRPGDNADIGRFGHHPDPAIDFEIEVESLGSIIADKELGLRDGEPLPVYRMEQAMAFRVGGVPSAVAAKDTLRNLETRLHALLSQARP